MSKRGNHETLHWSWGGWRFVLPAASSFIAVFQVEGSTTPWDMAPRPPRKQSTQLAFEVACVEWMINTVPDHIGAKIPELNY